MGLPSVNRGWLPASSLNYPDEVSSSRSIGSPEHLDDQDGADDRDYCQSEHAEKRVGVVDCQTAHYERCSCALGPRDHEVLFPPGIGHEKGPLRVGRALVGVTEVGRFGQASAREAWKTSRRG